LEEVSHPVGRGSWAWLVYLLVGILATGVYFLLPSASAQNIFYDLIGFSAVAAIVVGVRIHRPVRPLHWYVLGLGLLILVFGEVIWTYYENVLGLETPFPSVGDAFYLVAMPCITAGLVLIHRTHVPGHQWANLIDSLIIATVAGMLSWIFLMEPHAQDQTRSLLERLISMAYPLMDLVVLVAALQLWLISEKRLPVHHLLNVSLVFLLIADTVYAATLLADTYMTGHPLDAGWLLFYVLFGAAALHPSMIVLSEPLPVTEAKLTWLRLVLLTGTSLIAPTVLAYQAAFGEYIDVPVIVGGSVVLFVLAAARMAGMISSRKRVEEVLQESEQRFRNSFRDAAIGMALVATDGHWLQVNRSLCRIVGYSEQELLNKTFQDITHPDDLEADLGYMSRLLAGEIDTYQMEKRYFHKNGSVVWILLSVSLVHDAQGTPLNFVAQIQDITERKVLKEQLEHQALYDHLTDLPNRALLMNRLEHVLARTTRREGKVAVLFIDLDNFKIVNDSLGHEVGDALLVEVAERLKAWLRPEDTLARFGGDEFVVVLEDIASINPATRVAERSIEELREPFAVEGREMVVTASIGIALATSSQEQPKDLLRKADTAMYGAKERGKAQYKVFEPSMNVRVLERLELENDLRQGLERDEFRIYYQPQVLLETSKIVGLEAFVRWEHPERGLLTPAEFVAVAEESGLIVSIGRRVLWEACHQAREWQKLYPSDPPLVVCVNISGRQFQHPGLVQEVAQALQESRLEPGSLDLEITENVLVEDIQSNASVLRRLKRLGVKLIIDDFGTGYSSLSYLKRLPVDFLKIDGSFVEGLGKDPKDDGIVSTVIDLTHTLGVEAIAEGVRTPEQATRLQELGCHFAQGYLFSKPLPSAEIGALLATEISER
jgi:diguanylate cyclase (GGDEF)-like protein/PAS domain S-box-containing protein